jgi:hypothetical protein
MSHAGARSETPGGSVLERLARRGPPAPVGARCEMCAEPIADAHGHVVDVSARGLLCVCRPCYLLFTPEGAGNHHYRAVPDRYVALDPGAIGPQQWDRLEIPVSVAFFFHHSVLGHVVGLYPGPGGATESQLGLDAWADVVAAVPELASLAPDVEAVLVRGGGGGATEASIVPIDRCYELTGRLRAVWRGIDGGAEARAALDDVFGEIADRCGRGGAR